MSNHRSKRPFAGASADRSQRQITSFFSARPATDSDASPPQVRAPRLPSPVQSNLLTVGMRIRKSVPEGYKTPGPSAFKLWTDNTPALANTAVATPSSRSTLSRELLPFCGIHKVGGLATQPGLAHEDEVDEEEDDDVPGLTLSQESVESDETPDPPSRKRAFDPELESGVLSAQFFSLNGSSTDLQGLAPVRGDNSNTRLLATPKSRSLKPLSLSGNGGQENTLVDGDFEDADFLVLADDHDLNMS